MNLSTSSIRLAVGTMNRVFVDADQTMSGFCVQMRIMPGYHRENDGGRAWLARRKGDPYQYILLAPDSRWKTDFETEEFYDLREITFGEAQP